MNYEQFMFCFVFHNSIKTPAWATISYVYHYQINLMEYFINQNVFEASE